MMSRHDSLAWWVAVFLLSTAVLYTRVAEAPAPQSVDTSLTFFPLKLNEWSCIPVDGNAASYRDASTDYSWVGKCWKTEHALVLDVHIGYASGVPFRSRNLSPRLNHPGLGLDDRWSFIPQDHPSNARQKSDSRPLPCNQILLSHSSGPRIAVLYWYQVGNSIYGDDYRYRVALLIQRLFRRRTASQLVRISTTVKTAEENSAFDAIHELAELFAPVARSRFTQ